MVAQSLTTAKKVSLALTMALGFASASVFAQTGVMNETIDETAAALERNLLDRCERVPAELRTDCLTQMRGEAQTDVYGSVSGGGILRKTIITIPGETYTPEPTTVTPEHAEPGVTVHPAQY